MIEIRYNYYNYNKKNNGLGKFIVIFLIILVLAGGIFYYLNFSDAETEINGNFYHDEKTIYMNKNYSYSDSELKDGLKIFLNNGLVEIKDHNINFDEIGNYQISYQVNTGLAVMQIKLINMDHKIKFLYCYKLEQSLILFDDSKLTSPYQLLELLLPLYYGEAKTVFKITNLMANNYFDEDRVGEWKVKIGYHLSDNGVKKILDIKIINRKSDVGLKN